MRTFLIVAGLMYAGLATAEAQLRRQMQSVQGGCPNGNCPTSQQPQNVLLQQPFAPQAPLQQQTYTPSQPTVIQQTTTEVQYRNPVGHTHTCAHCGLTWDHQANPTHICQRCGASQYVVDAVPRLVPITVVKQQPKQRAVIYSNAPPMAINCNCPKR